MDIYEINKLNNKARLQLYEDFYEFFRANKKEFARNSFPFIGHKSPGHRWKIEELSKIHSFYINVSFHYGTYYDLTNVKNLAYAICEFRFGNMQIAHIAVHKDNWDILLNLFTRIRNKSLLTEVFIDANFIFTPYIPGQTPILSDGWVDYRGINVKLTDKKGFGIYHKNEYPKVWYSGTPILIVEKEENKAVWRGDYLK